MNPTLVMIISMVVVIAVYVIIAELYTTFRSSAYIGTAALVIALYFANDVFVNSHPQWPWLVIVLACLLVSEIVTGLLSRYHKTNVGLIMLSCAIVGMSAFKILKLKAGSLFSAIAVTIVLICMIVYTLWSVRKRSIAKIRDMGNSTTGSISGILVGIATLITLEWIFGCIWADYLYMHKVLKWIIGILLAVASAVLWIVIDRKKDEKRKERYSRLANELTLAREHYMNMMRDLDGLIDSVSSKDKKMITETLESGNDYRRFKQLKKIPAEKMTFYEYNDMLRIYPKLKTVFDPEYVREELRSVYFNGCSDKEELTARYKQLAKVFHTDNAGGDKDSFIRLKKEYDDEMARLNGSTSKEDKEDKAEN